MRKEDRGSESIKIGEADIERGREKEREREQKITYKRRKRTRGDVWENW